MLSDKQIHDILFYIAILFLIIGFVTLLLLKFEFTLGSISIVIACISIRVSIRSQWISDKSQVIADKSMSLSQKSDDRVKGISNSLFLDIISSFEDRRLGFQQEPRMIHIYLWKALVDLQRVNTMTKYTEIEKENLNTLGNRYVQLLIQVNKPRIKGMLLCEDIQHILNMYRLIKSFRIDKKIKSKATRKLKLLLGIEETITKEYLSSMIVNVTEENRWSLFINKREEIIYYKIKKT